MKNLFETQCNTVEQAKIFVELGVENISYCKYRQDGTPDYPTESFGAWRSFENRHLPAFTIGELLDIFGTIEMWKAGWAPVVVCGGTKKGGSDRRVYVWNKPDKFQTGSTTAIMLADLLIQALSGELGVELIAAVNQFLKSKLDG